MDPTANLDEQLRLADRILSGQSYPEDAARLAELVQALNEWIEGGGFLPHEWRERNVKRPTRFPHGPGY